MSGKMFKRPSSARRNIKQEAFSQSVSSTRLSNVQSILSGNPSSGSGSPDSILCILGIDGRYNDGTRELVNYLLFGFFDSRKIELERSGFAEEIIDDMIFLIRPKSVDVYCNPINYHYLLPYVAHWKNLHIHCIKEEEYDDDEKVEEFKIKSFIAMVEGCTTIGIPYSYSAAQTTKFDKMLVEKWPIIQAFALDEFGGGGFFSLKHEVVDVSGQIHTLYHKMDPVSLEAIITEQLPLFERQWSSVVTLFDADSSNRLQKINETVASEPLRSYFNHGRLSGKGDGSASSRFPYIVFGSHTLKKELNAIQLMAKSLDSTLLQTGITKKYATHMICQAVSPKGPISCKRTYFFETGVLPHPVSSNQVGKTESTKNKSYDARLLVSVYLGCIAAVIEGIQVYANTLDPQLAAESSIVALKAFCRTSDIPLNPEWLDNSKNVQFTVEAFDNLNRVVPLSHSQSVPLIKTAGIVVYDIPSLENKGEKLGSLAFSESFLESSLFVERTVGKEPELNGEHVVLTSQIPRFIAWPAGGLSGGCKDSQGLLDPKHTSSGHCGGKVAREEFKCSQSVLEGVENNSLDLFGADLIRGESAMLAVDREPCDVIRGGKLYVYERGVVYTHPHHGNVVIPKSELSAIHFYDGDSPSVVALLILSYHENVTSFLPANLKSDQNRIIVVLHPKTKAYRNVFSEVLPLWKQSDQEPQLKRIDDIPEELQLLHNEVQSEFDVVSRPQTNVSPLKKARTHLPGLESFMAHFSASSVGQQLIANKHLSAVLGQGYDAGGFSDHKELLVTVIGGVPGSHKEVLCQTLVKMSKEDNPCVVIKQPIDGVEMFSRNRLHSQLAALWNNNKQTKSGIPSQNIRVLLVTPGFTDIVDVIQAFSSHPDPQVAGHIKVGAVTVCVDPQNSYMCDNYPLPKLLDMCAQGWVNNIVLTGTTASQKVEMEHLQQLLRAVNSDVAFLIAPHGEMSRSPDIDLVMSEDAFNQEDFIRARYLSCPGWRSGLYDCGPCSPDMNEIALRFSRPLEKSRFYDRLTGLKSGHSKFPFSGNVLVLRGKIQFTDSSQVYEVNHVVLSGFTRLTPAEMNPTPPSAHTNGLEKAHLCSMVFTGCQLEENKLRDWLQGCAPQKPEKKLHRTRKSLSKMEINKVHKERHLETLPEGWFYNGAKFVSMAGDKSDTHPNMEEFLGEYLAKLNLEVDKYNAVIAKQEHHDLFE